MRHAALHAFATLILIGAPLHARAFVAHVALPQPPPLPPGTAATQDELLAPLDPASLGYKPLTDVEQSPDFDTYKSVYRGTDTDESWKDSPAFKSYGDEASYKADVSKNGVLLSFQRLRNFFDTSGAFLPGAGNADRIRASLLKEMDQYISELTAIGADDPIPLTNEFDEHSYQQGTAVLSDTYFFVGRSTQVVLEGQIDANAGAPAEPGAPPMQDFQPVYYATIQQAIEFRAVTLRIDAIFRAVKEPRYKRVNARLTQIDLGWSNYLEKGFSQYPWESAINSYWPKLTGGFSWEHSPQNQLVFLHPELGVELDIRSAQDASASAAVLIHALGYIHYVGPTRDWFYGASASLVFGPERFGLGVGPTLHLGWSKMHSVLPHVSVGAYWHDFDSGSNGPILGISLDFWRLVNKTGGEDLFEAALAGTK